MDRHAAVLLVVLAACFNETSSVGDGDDETSSAAGSSEDSSAADASTDASSTSAAASDGSGSTSHDAETSSETSDTPPSCGNAIVESDEPCDDGNADELDGCTQTCALGPRAIALTPVAPPAIAGDGSFNIDLPCSGAGALALGELFGHRGGASMDNAWTVSAGGRCSSLELVDGGVVAVTPDQLQLDEQGNDIGQIDQWSLPCPAGSVAVGVDVRIYADAIPNIRAMQLQCAVPRLVEQEGEYTIALDPPVPTGWTATPPPYGEESSRCPDGSVAVGFRGHIDAAATAIYAMGVTCALPTVVVGPP